MKLNYQSFFVMVLSMRLHLEMVCDPLGDYNVWASTRPINNTAKGHKMWENVVIAAARVSSLMRALVIDTFVCHCPCESVKNILHAPSVVISFSLEAFQYKSQALYKVLLCKVHHVTSQSQIQSHFLLWRTISPKPIQESDDQLIIL